MPLFANPKKRLARETAQRLASGHLSLLAFWTLKHAGVFQAMREMPEGIHPLLHAGKTAMSAEVLQALLQYLAAQGLLICRDDMYSLSPAAAALLEHDDGVLDLLRAYQPVTSMLEHLLARLKSYGHGVTRKYDAVIASQNQRWREEVFPAILQALGQVNATCLLDLHCGTGHLLTFLAMKNKNLVGVGLSPDGPMVHAANDLIATLQLEKRLIAVPANGLEAASEPARTFERVGVSQQLWQKFDAILLPNLLTELHNVDAGKAADILAHLAKSFPKAHLLLLEPCDSPRLAKNYYTPEFLLLSQLSLTKLLPTEHWTSALQNAGYQEVQKTPLTTDGLTLFITKVK